MLYVAPQLIQEKPHCCYNSTGTAMHHAALRDTILNMYSHTHERPRPCCQCPVHLAAPATGDAAVHHASDACCLACLAHALCRHFQGLSNVWNHGDALPSIIWAETGRVGPVCIPVPDAFHPAIMAVGHLGLLPGVLGRKLACRAVRQPAAAGNFIRAVQHVALHMSHSMLLAATAVCQPAAGMLIYHGSLCAV